MSTESDESETTGSESTKIDVRVPTQLLERIDAEYETRGYTSRSEAVRDALRSWIDPPVQLSEELLADLAVSREQRNRGDTRSLEDVMVDHGVESDSDSVDETEP